MSTAELLTVQPSLRVRAAELRDEENWDQFVRDHQGGTFFHRFAWGRLLQRVFGMQPYYLIAERDRKILGILPLVHQKSLLFGNTLSSVPFCVEAGPLGADAEAMDALDHAAVGIMNDLKVQVLEYRTRTASRTGWASKRDLYATFSRAISADDEENLKGIPRKQRAVVRKTLKSEMSSEVHMDVEALYKIYSTSLRNLGTPVFPRRWFRELITEFGQDCDVVVVHDRGEPVSAVMNFYFRGTVLPYYGGGTEAARRSGANDFLYWEVMRRAACRGYRRFDFGRSKAGTGAFAFKKNWGFEPDWLEYQYYLSSGREIPENNPNNPKYALAIAAWKRLPLPVANFVGPFLIRGLG